MPPPGSFTARTFASLAVRNFRLFFIGQLISMSGTWMQAVAQGLLVLQLTGSGTLLGVVTALQALPVLFIGPFAGVIIDRLPKRQILIATNVLSAIQGVLLGALVMTGNIEMWMVFVLAAFSGLLKAFDNPTRQTFVRELVGPQLLTNAVSLNSMAMNIARIIGPTLAGILIATIGIGACFVLNGFSFIAVLALLYVMDFSVMHIGRAAPKKAGQLQEGLRYIRQEPVLGTILAMMMIIGTFTFEFATTLPLFAKYTLDSGDSGYAAIQVAMGIGAVIGGLYTASRKGGRPQLLVISAALFGGSVLLASFAPNLAFGAIAMTIVGFCSINFTSLGNVTLQLSARPDMQGRVMALWSVAFLGTTPIGGPIMGAVGEHLGARIALVAGGIAALAAAGLGYAALDRMNAAVASRLQRERA